MDKANCQKECFVPTCSNTNENAPEKLFLTTPHPNRAPIRRAAWFAAVGRQNTNKTLTFCCEDHFKLPTDAKNWMFFKTAGQTLKLNPAVVPHIHLNENNVPKNHSQLSPISIKRKHNFLLGFQSTPSTSKDSGDNQLVTLEEETPAKIAKESISLYCVADYSENLNDDESRRSSSEMTDLKYNFNPALPSCVSFSSTNVSCHSLTDEEFMPSGSQESNDDFDQARVMQERCKSTMLLMETKSRFYLGLQKEMYVLIECVSNESHVYYRDIMISLKKIRSNDQYTRLADDFGMSVSNVQRIFTNTVLKIADYMSKLIFWPDSKLIKLFLPIPFRANYSKVESIIDCFEIPIEKPSNTSHQILTWSEYKQANTIKYFVSATPNGFINFVSRGYGGRITDNEISKLSGFFEVLPAGSEVLADRGFKFIEAFLNERNCKLVRPCSVVTGQQLSKADVIRNRNIAALRIHIERVIRRFREFQMLSKHACISSRLLHLLDHCIIIAAAIINTQNALIK